MKQQALIETWYPESHKTLSVLIEQQSQKRIEVWERLQTKAPCPDKAVPYCCYMRTVIFYVGPWYVVRPWHSFYLRRSYVSAVTRKPVFEWSIEKPGSKLEQWDQIEYELDWDRVFRWNEQDWQTGGGKVLWMGKGSGWWMKHWAARKEEKK